MMDTTKRDNQIDHKFSNVEKTMSNEIRDQTLGKDGGSLPQSDNIDVNKDILNFRSVEYTHISSLEGFRLTFSVLVTVIAITMSISGGSIFLPLDKFGWKIKHNMEMQLNGKSRKRLQRVMDKHADKYRRMAIRYACLKRKQGMMYEKQYKDLFDETVKRFVDINELVKAEMDMKPHVQEFTQEELAQTFSKESTLKMLGYKKYLQMMANMDQEKIGMSGSGSKKGDGPDTMMQFEQEIDDAKTNEVDIFMYHIHYYKTVKHGDTLEYWTKLRFADAIQSKNGEEKLIDRHAKQEVILEGNVKKDVTKNTFRKADFKRKNIASDEQREKTRIRMESRASRIVQTRIQTPIRLARTIRHDSQISRKWAEALAQKVVEMVKTFSRENCSKELIALVGYCENLLRNKTQPNVIDIEYIGLIQLNEIVMVEDSNIDNIIDEQQREQVKRMLRRQTNISPELQLDIGIDFGLQQEPEPLEEKRMSWEDTDLIRKTGTISVRVETSAEIETRLARGNIELNPGPIAELKMVMEKVKNYKLPQAITQLNLNREEICRSSFIEEDMGKLQYNNGSTIITNFTSACGSQWQPMGLGGAVVSPTECFTVIGTEFRQKRTTVAMRLTATGVQMKLHNDAASTTNLTQVMRTNNEYFNGFSVAALSLMLSRMQDYMDQSVVRTSFTRIWLGFYKFIACKFPIGSGLTFNRNETWSETVAGNMDRQSARWVAMANPVGPVLEQPQVFLITTKMLSDWLMGRLVITAAGPVTFDVQNIGQDQGIGLVILDELLISNPRLTLLVMMCQMRSKLLDRATYTAEVGNNSDVENFNLYGNGAGAPQILWQNVFAERVYLQGPKTFFLVLPPGQENLANYNILGNVVVLHVNGQPGAQIAAECGIAFNTSDFQELRTLETYMNKWYNDPVGKDIAFRLISNYTNRYFLPSSSEIGVGPRVYPRTTNRVPNTVANLNNVERDELYRNAPIDPAMEALWGAQFSFSAMKEPWHVENTELTTGNSSQFATTFVSGHNYYVDMMRHLDIIALGEKVTSYCDVNISYHSRNFAGLLATMGDLFVDEVSIAQDEFWVTSTLGGANVRQAGMSEQAWNDRKKLSIKTLHMWFAPTLEFSFDYMKEFNYVQVLSQLGPAVIPVFESINFYTSRIEDKLNEEPMYSLDVPFTPVPFLNGAQARQISAEKLLLEDKARYFLMREMAGSLVFGWLNEQSTQVVDYNFAIMDSRLVAAGTLQAMKFPVINDCGGRKEYAYKLTWGNRIISQTGDADRCTNFNFIVRMEPAVGLAKRLAVRAPPTFTYGKVKLGGSAFKNSNWHKGFTLDTTYFGASEFTMPDVDFDLNSESQQPPAAEEEKTE